MNIAIALMIKCIGRSGSIKAYDHFYRLQPNMTDELVNQCLRGACYRGHGDFVKHICEKYNVSYLTIIRDERVMLINLVESGNLDLLKYLNTKYQLTCDDFTFDFGVLARTAKRYGHKEMEAYIVENAKKLTETESKTNGAHDIKMAMAKMIIKD